MDIGVRGTRVVLTPFFPQRPDSPGCRAQTDRCRPRVDCTKPRRDSRSWPRCNGAAYARCGPRGDPLSPRPWSSSADPAAWYRINRPARRIPSSAGTRSAAPAADADAAPANAAGPTQRWLQPQHALAGQPAGSRLHARPTPSAAAAAAARRCPPLLSGLEGFFSSLPPGARCMCRSHYCCCVRGGGVVGPCTCRANQSSHPPSRHFHHPSCPRRLPRRVSCYVRKKGTKVLPRAHTPAMQERVLLFLGG